MKSKKPLGVRIVIWICVIFMVVSLIGVYVVYMFSPNQEAGDVEGVGTGSVESLSGSEEILILPEVDPENPESTDAPILVTEDGEVDEMDETFEVQLENGETEVVRQGDLSDVIQIN